MLKINVIKSKFMHGIMDQNTYVLSNQNEAVIIDAGAELEDIKNAVGDKKVLGILMTHLHFDHFWCLEDYVAEFNCNVFINQGAEYKFGDSQANGSVILRLSKTIFIEQNIIKYYAKKLKLGSFEFEIIETPGHTADCVCILINNNLFTGDTIFADDIGRTDLIDSDANKMIDSLKKIKNINYDFAYPGHYNQAEKKHIDRIIDRYLF